MAWVSNIYKYNNERTFRNCTIITVPGKDGFLWIDNLGELHNGGMNISVCTGDVQVLHDPETGKVSYGWYSK